MRKKFMWGVVFACATIIAFVGVWPRPIASLWHVVYGNQVKYKDYRVSVPPGWISLKSENQLVLHKAGGVLVPWALRDYGTIAFLPGLPAGRTFAPEDIPAWRRAVKKRLSHRGFGEPILRVVQVGEQPGYCLEAWSLSQEDRGDISCFISGGNVFVSFEGKPNSAKELYGVLESLELEKDRT